MEAAYLHTVETQNGALEKNFPWQQVLTNLPHLIRPIIKI